MEQFLLLHLHQFLLTIIVMGIHLVMYVIERNIGKNSPREMADNSDGNESEEEYEVERLLTRRVHGGAVQYEVKWVGYGEEVRAGPAGPHS